MVETFNLKGTLRTRLAEETLEKIKPFIERAGITRLVNFTQLDSIGIPVYSCIRPLSKNLSTSQGKGITPALAMCSAYMEAIECFFAEQVLTDFYRDAWDSDPLPYPEVDLDLLQTGSLYTSRLREKIKEWTLVSSLISEKKYCLPTHYLKFDLSTPVLENAFFRKTTTGLASGNTREEALCHSLFEIIERHAKHTFDTYSPSKKQQCLIDLDTVDYPEARFLIERLQENHIDILLFDLPNPFNYPSLACLIGDQSPLRKLGTYNGAGTHAHPGIAACRAITEAIQSRLTYIAGSRDDILPSEYQIKWSPLNFKGEKHFDSLVPQYFGSLHEQYLNLIECFEQQGLDILAYAHNDPEDPISIMKCVVPGLAI